jgi:hypothetical protein
VLEYAWRWCVSWYHTLRIKFFDRETYKFLTETDFRMEDFIEAPRPELPCGEEIVHERITYICDRRAGHDVITGDPDQLVEPTLHGRGDVRWTQDLTNYYNKILHRTVEAKNNG